MCQDQLDLVGWSDNQSGHARKQQRKRAVEHRSRTNTSVYFLIVHFDVSYGHQVIFLSTSSFSQQETIRHRNSSRKLPIPALLGSEIPPDS